jgi:hypothetical protein
LTGAGSQPSGSGSQGTIFKIAPAGEVIWNKTYIYPGNSGNEFQKTVETWNGDLVTTGLTDNLSNSGWLVRTDSLGEVIWQREYDKNQHTDLFYSILATDDGGFLLSGVARNTETNSPDAWLLKVDSMGCAYADCPPWVGVGVEEIEENDVTVDVYPNPFSNNFNLRYALASEAKDVTVEVYDLVGRSVKTVQLRNVQNGQVAIELGECLGIYILRMTADGKQVHQQKMVCLSH